MASQRGFGAVALEMASIVIAIVLGFAVSNWDESRRARARGDLAVERIRLELLANRERMAGLPAYYVRVVQEIDSVTAATGGGSFDMRTLSAWEGMRPPDIRTSAFDIAVMTGALEHVDFEVADRLASIYGILDQIRQTTDAGMQSLISGTMGDYADVRMFMILMREQVVTFERSVEDVESVTGGVSGSPDG